MAAPPAGGPAGPGHSPGLHLAGPSSCESLQGLRQAGSSSFETRSEARRDSLRGPSGCSHLRDGSPGLHLAGPSSRESLQGPRQAGSSSYETRSEARRDSLRGPSGCSHLRDGSPGLHLPGPSSCESLQGLPQAGSSNYETRSEARRDSLRGPSGCGHLRDGRSTSAGPSDSAARGDSLGVHRAGPSDSATGEDRLQGLHRAGPLEEAREDSLPGPSGCSHLRDGRSTSGSPHRTCSGRSRGTDIDPVDPGSSGLRYPRVVQGSSPSRVREDSDVGPDASGLAGQDRSDANRSLGLACYRRSGGSDRTDVVKEVPVDRNVITAGPSRRRGDFDASEVSRGPVHRSVRFIDASDSENRKGVSDCKIASRYGSESGGKVSFAGVAGGGKTRRNVDSRVTSDVARIVGESSKTRQDKEAFCDLDSKSSVRESGETEPSDSGNRLFGSDLVDVRDGLGNVELFGVAKRVGLDNVDGKGGNEFSVGPGVDDGSSSGGLDSRNEFGKVESDLKGTHDDVGSLSRSDDLSDYAGHSLLMHMYKIDDKDYDDCFDGDYNNLRKLNRKRTLEQTHKKSKGKVSFGGEVINTNRDDVSTSDKIGCKSEDLDDSYKSVNLDRLESKGDDNQNQKISSIKEKLTTDEINLKISKRPEYLEIEKEDTKGVLSKHKLYGTERSVPINLGSTTDEDEPNGNGDSNNNVVEEEVEEEKLTVRATWSQRSPQVPEKQRTAMEEREPYFEERVVSSNVSSSGVEGSSERSDSDESQKHQQKNLMGLKELPTVTKRYRYISQRSGTSDSYSEKEGESSSHPMTAVTEEKEDLSCHPLICKEHARPVKERKRLVVKVMPAKKDSSSDSATDDDNLPSSDISERRARRTKKEKRFSSNVTLPEKVLAAVEDSGTSEDITSSDSARRNKSDSFILDRRVKKIKKVTSLENKSTYSKSQELTKVKKITTVKNGTPLRQASYKIAVKNGQLQRSTLNGKIKQVEMNKASESDLKADTDKDSAKKPLLRKISYEKAVRGGLLSITPSPTSISSIFKPKDASDSGTPSRHFRPIKPKSIDERKILSDEKIIEENRYQTDDSKETEISDLTITPTDTMTSPFDARKYSNFEKILPIGGIMTLIKGKGLSESSSQPGSLISLSWDSQSVQCSDKAHSLDSLPSTLSFTSRHSSQSSNVEEPHISTKNPSISILDWNEIDDTEISQSKSLQSLSVKSPEKVIEDTTTDESDVITISEKKTEQKSSDKPDTTESNPYDEMMKIMLKKGDPDVNKSVVRKMKSSLARESSYTARKFLLEGEVILLDDDIPVCEDCNIASMQILWARQIIARLDDSHIYANLPPYSENLTVISRILAKSYEESSEIIENIETPTRSVSSPRKVFKKSGILRKKGSRRNVSKFIKGAIEVIPELSEETDEDSVNGNKGTSKSNGAFHKGCKRRNLTRRAYAYDMKRLKKLKDKLDDYIDPNTQSELSEEKPNFKNHGKPINQSPTMSLMKYGMKNRLSSHAFESCVHRPALPLGISETCECDSDETTEHFEAKAETKISSVRFSRTDEPNNLTDDKHFMKPWWKFFAIPDFKKTKSRTFRSSFPNIPLSMNLIQHDNGRLEIMYGEEEEYPYTTGEYSAEDGRYLTLEEFFLKKYNCYQPPEDYFFSIDGHSSNLTVIKMNLKPNFVRSIDAKSKFCPPMYVFQSTNEEGRCPNKRNSNAAKYIQQWFARIDTSPMNIGRGFLEKPMPRRRVSIPYMPSYDPIRKTTYTPPKVGPKPIKLLIDTDYNKKITETHFDEPLTPNLPTNVQNLIPGTYFYPYSIEDNKPSFFVKVIMCEHITPVISFHCIDSHPALQHLADMNLHSDERWEQLIFRTTELDFGINIQKYNLATYPPSYVSEENIVEYGVTNFGTDNIEKITTTSYDPTDTSKREIDVSILENPSQTTEDEISIRGLLHTDDQPRISHVSTPVNVFESHQAILERHSLEQAIIKSAPMSNNELSRQGRYNWSYPNADAYNTLLASRLSKLSQLGNTSDAKPEISAVTVLATKHLEPHRSSSYPGIHSPTQLSSLEIEIAHPSSENQPILELQFDSRQYPKRYPLPLTINLESQDGSSKAINISVDTQQLCINFRPEYPQTDIQTVDTPSQNKPDWYLPRQSGTSSMPQPFKTEPKLPQASPRTRTLNPPEYVNMSMIKETHRMIGDYKYPWESTSTSQRLLVQDKVTVQRRKSTGETTIPYYGDALSGGSGAVTRLEPRQSRESHTDDRVEYGHSVPQHSNAPHSVSPTLTAIAERQQQISPSYYSLSHYPLTDAWQGQCSCLQSGVHFETTHPQPCPHSRLYSGASRHSFRTNSRYFPPAPIPYPRTIRPPMSGYAESIETDSDLEPYLMSSSSCPSTDTYHQPYTYPCTGKHSYGTVCEKVKLCKKQIQWSNDHTTLQKKAISRSSEFLSGVRRRCMNIARSKRLYKSSCSDDDVAERIAYHYLIGTDTETTSGESKGKRLKPKQDSGRYLHHSSEDIANRIAYHYVTDTDIGEVSMMSSHSTITSPYHGRQSQATSVQTDLPQDTKVRSTPFLWCGSHSPEPPYEKQPEKKSSPLWGKFRTGRTKTV